MGVFLLKSKQLALEFQANSKKFKKYHKIKYKVVTTSILVKNNFGLSLFSKKHLNLNTKQLLTILKIIKPELKSFLMSRINLNFKLDTIITRKPKDIRMGRGKGSPVEKVFSYKAGDVLFTLYGLPTVIGVRVLNTCKLKLPSATYVKTCS